jgi:hypothetical protein
MGDWPVVKPTAAQDVIYRIYVEEHPWLVCTLNSRGNPPLFLQANIFDA